MKLEDFRGRIARAPDPSDGAWPVLRVAVLLPCYNEEVAIARTIASFRDALPGASIYVYDNRSTDRTSQIARAAGAIVRTEPYPGKGSTVRRMFADVEADVYVLADGDATYHAPSAPLMIDALLGGNLDMVCGARRDRETEAYRPGHRFGNRLLTGLVSTLFGRRFDDMLTGYRVFSRRFVKSFPSASRGFEIETELTVHALQLRLPAAEVETPYAARPENSFSKLGTFRDGFLILRTIGILVKEEKPLQFFAALACAMFVPSAAVFASVLGEFMGTGLVDRMPSLFASLSGMILAALSLACAMILDSIARGRRELRYMNYLRFEAPR